MLPEALQTSRLRLRPIESGDAQSIFNAYAQNPDVTRYLIWKPHKTLAESESYVSQCVSASAETRVYAICGRTDGQLRGALALRRPDRHHVDTGYVLARTWWGQGIMTEALTAAVEWAFAQPEIFRFSACCDVDNLASARVMEKSGLLREGLARRYLIHPNISDDPRDCLLYARARWVKTRGNGKSKATLTPSETTMRKLMTLAALLALAGCASGRAVQLSRGNDIVQCGPYSSPSIGVSSNLDEFAERKLQGCIERFQAQGYQLVYPADNANAAAPAKP